jgi:hypothetical protein
MSLKLTAVTGTMGTMLRVENYNYCGLLNIQSVSGGIVNILGGGSMDYSE